MFFSNVTDISAKLWTPVLHDYSYYQPIARIVRNVNEFGQYMQLNRTRFKIEVKKELKKKDSDKNN